MRKSQVVREGTEARQGTGCHPGPRSGIESVRETGGGSGQSGCPGQDSKTEGKRGSHRSPCLFHFAVWWPHDAVGGSQSRTIWLVRDLLGGRRLATGTGLQGTLGLPLCHLGGQS